MLNRQRKESKQKITKYIFYSQVFKNMEASLVAQLIKILPAMQETPV